jgi:hypothetical protein
MERLPLPNSIKCPALELFRKYKYPDDHTIQQFKEPVIVEVLEKIISTETKPTNEETAVGRTTGAETK